MNSIAISPVSLEQLFTEARTQNGWTDRPVDDATLRALYELVKMGPTSMNCQPMRVVFLTTPEAKAPLLDALLPGNVDKTRAAPVTAIIAYDSKFYDHIPRIWHNAAARDMFASNEALSHATAFRNGSMQGGYFILAARAVGLECGPMSGFDAEKVNSAFFAGSTYRVNFLCNLGYGDPSVLMPRQPRLAFDEVCRIAK
ncbi:malonic semialdehyde reductase [Parapusillimonas granuli]|uniref:Putative NADH dehydrogenase/NAD(P)H nitroreductase H0A72_07345 n=1 Tax=Parapusillimonas granuli TaxID=380911 RepID=A0A853FTC7_9BURK|nr:malonic semialdehyde reductase [Parapusillimonas granuli]MBB5214466.1 3-hydroxypropanoate dehydrogenase [Parapusillimonas granuli]NYT49125.1 malonic semialdehyde reductase [Parapusillimonas granuli]